MIKYLLVTMLIVSGCAHEDAWTRRDTAMQIGVTMLIAYDAHLTANLKNHDGFTEGGNLARHVLGRNPESSDTYQYFFSFAIFDYVISRSLPAKWRPYWQGFNMIDNASGIRRHCLDDLC